MTKKELNRITKLLKKLNVRGEIISITGCVTVIEYVGLDRIIELIKGENK